MSDGAWATLYMATVLVVFLYAYWLGHGHGVREGRAEGRAERSD